jgi:hypothetical protein
MLLFLGAFYLDGTRGRDKLDDMVQPGTTYTYKWYMTKTFAPTEDDDNCIPLGYHPHVRSHKDIDTGLIGMIIVCKPGMYEWVRVMVINPILKKYFSYIMGVSFIEGGNWRTQRKPLTCHKSLTNFIT